MLPLALLLVTAAAPPEAVAARIERARAALEALEFETCALELTLAADDPRASEAEKIEANLYAGICHRVLGRDTDARLNFIYVLKRAPATELPPDVSPKIRTFYVLIRDELGLAPKPKPEPATLDASADAPAGDALEVGTAPLRWLVVGGGGAVAAAGAFALVVGTGPWFTHESALRELDAAALANADGSAPRARVNEARAEWEAWGALASTTGALAVLVGAGIAAAGLVLVEDAP